MPTDTLKNILTEEEYNHKHDIMIPEMTEAMELNKQKEDTLERVKEEFKRRIDFATMTKEDKKTSIELLETIIRGEIDGD